MKNTLPHNHPRILPGVLMGRRTITTDTKRREAAPVMAAYERVRREEGMTQESLADEFGVSQGLVSSWLRGTDSIPDRVLLKLGRRLGFDAFEVRPSLVEYRDLLAQEGSIDERLSKLPSQAQAAILASIRAFESK